MLFSGSIVLAITALISVAATNSVTFYSLDRYARIVYWTPGCQSPGNCSPSIPTTYIGPFAQNVRVDLPSGWSGAFHTIFPGGNPSAPAIVGEVTFQGNNGATFFDISAVDNCCDNSGVHYLQPATAHLPLSGCQTFPCDGVYKHPGDMSTLSTPETDLACVVGTYGS